MLKNRSSHVRKNDGSGQLNGSVGSAATNIPTSAPAASEVAPTLETIGERPSFELTAKDRERMKSALATPEHTGDPVADSENAAARRYWAEVEAGTRNPYEIDNPWGDSAVTAVSEAWAGLSIGESTRVTVTTEAGRTAQVELRRNALRNKDGDPAHQVFGIFPETDEPPHLIWEGPAEPTLEEVAGAYDVEVEYLKGL